MGVQRTVRAVTAGPSAWTDERVRGALEEFCRGRTVWPPERVFREAGKERLYKAASRHGGVGYWADQLGLERYSRAQRAERRLTHDRHDRRGCSEPHRWAMQSTRWLR
jgi:hypothetical protein